jgi:EAL domain-containing protein (putative c-di-GMP-specific phosphodiesterase class I)
VSDFSLKEMLQFVIKHFKIVLISLIIFAFMGYYYANKSQSYTTSIMIEYDYYGIEQGKNPLGGKLDVYEVMSPSIIEKTIKSLKLRANVDDIRNRITITPFIDDETSEKIKASAEKGEDYEYFSPIYVITYVYPAVYGSDHGKFVLNKLLQSYDEFFIKKYTGSKALPDVLNTVDYSNYDYIEICDLINKQIENGKEFLGHMNKEDNNFRSATTGMSFSDLYRFFDKLENNEYGRLYSNVLAGRLSKDKDKLIKNYLYKIENLYLEKEKKNEESELSFSILDDFYTRYKEYKRLDVNDTGRQHAFGDVLRGFSINEILTTYDEILTNYVDSGVDAADAQHDIVHYSYIIETFKNDNVPQGEKQHLTKAVEELVTRIGTIMDDLVKSTNVTVNDYYHYKGNNFINHLSFVEVAANLSVKKYLLFSIFAGIGLGMMMAVFIETVPKLFKNKEEYENTVETEIIPLLSANRKQKHSGVSKYLDGAVEEHFKEFQLYFQPMVDTKGIWSDAEGLIRWESYDLGLVMPSEFIHIAEEDDSIIPLGEWVLREACIQCKKWNDSGYPDLGVSVNFSIKEIVNKNFIENVCTILREVKVNPKNITIEISNGDEIRDIEFMTQRLNIIKALGVRVAIDNFGTKHSSINALHELPIDFIKVDKRFAIDKEDNNHFIKNVLNLAHELNIRVCIKGIETEEQMNNMLKLGVDYMQGYYFARPISAEQFEIIYQYKNRRITNG